MNVRLVVVVACLVAGVHVGCTVTEAKPTSRANDAGNDAGVASSEAPPLSCLQILQCIVDCPSADEACPDACGEKGSSESKPILLAFATCVDREKCTDADCVQTKCADSLNACVTSSAPKKSQLPLQGGAPAGSVPGELVGVWSGAWSGATERLTFNSDGTGSWMSAVVVTQRSGCFSFTRTTRTGTVVIDPTKITLYATEILSQVQECKAPTTDSTEPAAVSEISWEPVDANTIRVVDAACAAQYVGYETSIGLYCTYRLSRE